MQYNNTNIPILEYKIVLSRLKDNAFYNNKKNIEEKSIF